jgi:NADH:ubiquinone oxidoreductase subunit 6 (subunit J)
MLAVHVASSVGWLGAVLVYLAFAVAAVAGDDVTVRSSVYVAMDWAAWVVLVPLAVASLLTGVVQSLVSPWGLLRHYWVVVKLAVTLVATAVLVAYTQTLSAFAEVASMPPLSDADAEFLGSPSVLLHTAGALVLLTFALVLGVFKPAGLTRRGQRHRHLLRQLHHSRVNDA